MLGAFAEAVSCKQWLKEVIWVRSIIQEYNANTSIDDIEYYRVGAFCLIFNL